MKSSDELREHLSAYLDGQLSGDLLEQMEAMLQQDESLRSELESLRELVAGLASFPAVAASPEFAARVMAEVAGLEIPASRDIGELDEVTSSQPDQEMEPLSVPWWLKGSIVTALAATLVLGYFVVRAPMMTTSAELASVRQGASPEASWGAPLATGLDDLSDFDGLAGADAGDPPAESGEAPEDKAFDASPQRPAARSAMPAPARVRQAERAATDAVAPVAQPASSRQRRKPTGLKEVAADSDGSAAVYEAEHEDQADGVDSVAAPVPDPESDGVVALDEEPDLADAMVRGERAHLEAEAEAEAEDDEVAVSGRLGRSSAAGARVDVEHTMPSGMFKRRASGKSFRGAAGRRSRASEAPAAPEPAAAAGAAAAEMESVQQVAVVSEEQSGEQADAPSIAAKVVIGTLVVASPGVISTLSSEIQAKEWSLQNLTPMMDPGAAFPATGSQILQIMVPQGAEEDLTALLSGYGALNTDRVLAAAHDGNARLRLTVRWGN
jgi:hypothetical protein